MAKPVSRTRQAVITSSAAPGMAIATDTMHKIGLVVVVLLALAASSFNSWQEWYSDLYFATAVQSMLTSWHNFFFVSFDPAGFISVDKPPLALWLQTGCGKLFGFRGLSLVLPAAVAGVLSVGVLYQLVRRAFGPTAGLLAALFLALTPICVATNRSNNMDSLVLFITLLGAWAISVAAETGRLRPLLVCAILLGVAFNTKWLQAFVVLPAFALLYLLTAPVPMSTRLVRLALAAAILVIVSLSWVTAVDLTPASQRPFVGSSGNNTALDLALNYNGLGRLTSGGQVASALTAQVGSLPGDPGPLRLLDEQLGGQVSWLLPLALIGLIAAGAREWQGPSPERTGRHRTATVPRRRMPSGRRQQALILWGSWLVTLGLIYSVAGYFHPYNLVMLAPAICALAGICVVTLWQEYSRPRGWRWLLPVALAGTALVQMGILLESPSWNPWLIPLVPGVALAAAAWLAASSPAMQARRPIRSQVVAAVGGLVLLIAPAAWASVPIWHYGNVEFPIAGPDLLDSSIDPPLQTLAFIAPATLTRYLLAHHHGERFIMAARYGGVAGPVMLATKQAVLTYGGYLGEDHILTVGQLGALVRGKAVRFFWVLAPRGGQNQGEIERWVAGRCAQVAAGLWQPSTGYGSSGPRLYDCASGG